MALHEPGPAARSSYSAAGVRATRRRRRVRRVHVHAHACQSRTSGARAAAAQPHVLTASPRPDRSRQSSRRVLACRPRCLRGSLRASAEGSVCTSGAGTAAARCARRCTGGARAIRAGSRDTTALLGSELAASRTYALEEIEARNDVPKDHVLAIALRRGGECKEELARVGVLASVGHGA